MNWKRIWTGTLWAAAVMYGMETMYSVFYGSVYEGLWLALQSIKAPLLLNLMPSVVSGFAVCCLYVLARPRLGPGLKTAWLIGSLGFLLGNLAFFNSAVWSANPGMMVIQFVFGWAKYGLATSVAGWQYFEKQKSTV